MSSSGVVVSPTVIAAAVNAQLPELLDETVVRQDQLTAALDNLAPALIEDPADEGTYYIQLPGRFSEDPADEGTYLIGVSS